MGQYSCTRAAAHFAKRIFVWWTIFAEWIKSVKREVGVTNVLVPGTSLTIVPNQISCNKSTNLYHLLDQISWINQQQTQVLGRAFALRRTYKRQHNYGLLTEIRCKVNKFMQSGTTVNSHRPLYSIAAAAVGASLLAVLLCCTCWCCWCWWCCCCCCCWWWWCTTAVASLRAFNRSSAVHPGGKRHMITTGFLYSSHLQSVTPLVVFARC